MGVSDRAREGRESLLAATVELESLTYKVHDTAEVVSR